MVIYRPIRNTSGLSGILRSNIQSFRSKNLSFDTRLANIQFINELLLNCPEWLFGDSKIYVTISFEFIRRESLSQAP